MINKHYDQHLNHIEFVNNYDVNLNQLLNKFENI
jgi:hypothetical protein